MREVHMQKTVRNALNSYAKNSAKCVKFMCEKHCEMRHFSANFPYFFAYEFGAFFSVFLQEIAGN